jgi:predicted enzyme related to lactoylglutathione lyase
MRLLPIVGLMAILNACNSSVANLATTRTQPSAMAQAAVTRQTEAIRYKQQTIPVKDIDKSAAFYSKHFGYTITDKQSFPDLQLIVLQRQDHRLQLMTGGTVAKLDWRHSMGFFARDFDKMAKELPILKAPFQVTPDGPRILFAKDPDGYPIEVIEDLPAAR